jgi:hypothetical protein
MMPIMGKTTFMYPYLKMLILVTKVAKTKILWANVFKTITAKAAEMPTNILDRNINCLLDILACDQTIPFSSL